jgi:hypothetical protein
MDERLRRRRTLRRDLDKSHLFFLQGVVFHHNAATICAIKVRLLALAVVIARWQRLFANAVYGTASLAPSVESRLISPAAFS